MLLVLPILLQCLSLGTASNCGFAKSPVPVLNTNGWHAYLCYLAISFMNECVIVKRTSLIILDHCQPVLIFVVLHSSGKNGFRV
jgi:hypothetical protein